MIVRKSNRSLVLLATCVWACTAAGATADAAPASAPTPTPNAAAANAPAAATPAPAATLEQVHAWQVRRGPYFERAWGIDIVGVRLTASNWMLEFKYRVVDPKKAKSLLSRKAKPYLTDEASGAKLAVPAMENIGELRQAAEPEAGRTYYILFGNADRVVKQGNRVTVDIGDLHADGIVVE